MRGIKCESEKAENDEGTEGRGIIEEVDDQPAEAGEAKTVEEGGKGRAPAAHECDELEYRGAHVRIERPEEAENRIIGG